MLVDTEGHLLAVLVLAADVSDRDGAMLLLQLYAARYPRLVLIWGDSHYGRDLDAAVQATFGIVMAVVSKTVGQEGFIPLPRRWVVERSLGWFTHCRPWRATTSGSRATVRPGCISRKPIGCSSIWLPTSHCRGLISGARRPSDSRTRSEEQDYSFTSRMQLV